MNVTPMVMPRRKVEPAAVTVYTTTTGDARSTRHATRPAPTFDAYEPYCFVCRRCTDHVGEHDALADAGLVEYSGGGVVSRTDKWDDDLASVIAAAEYEKYTAALLVGNR